MPLGPHDDLGFRPRRILLDGAPGSCKTTLAASLVEQLGLTFTEIDRLFHGPGWVRRESFLDDVRLLRLRRLDHRVAVRRSTADPAGSARPVRWLDYPRSRVMRRVVGRTVRRRVRGEVLWNGNREGPFRHFFTDPERIVRWAWSSYLRVAERAHAARGTGPSCQLSGCATTPRSRTGAPASAD